MMDGSQLPARARCVRSTLYSPGEARSSVATAGSSTSHSWVRPLQQRKEEAGRCAGGVRVDGGVSGGRMGVAQGGGAGHELSVPDVGIDELEDHVFLWRGREVQGGKQGRAIQTAAQPPQHHATAHIKTPKPSTTSIPKPASQPAHQVQHVGQLQHVALLDRGQLATPATPPANPAAPPAPTPF